MSVVVLVCAGLIMLNSCSSPSRGVVPGNAGPAAPEFPVGLQWLNVERPLTMQDLRGKVVVLDFWTFCCINCMHVIPDLHRLEAKYGDALAVVGVHSAKFATEKETDNIRQAILRYDVTHPVINDRDFEVWNSYGVSAWPTFVLIDPDGNVAASHSGEGPYDAFDSTIAGLIKQYDGQGKINRTPLPPRLEKDNLPATPLLFPGKIAVSGDRLIIADSNHNRLVIVKVDSGAIDEVIGDGVAGLKDGTLAAAEFYGPQGVAVDGQAIYVADTENHAIRKVDLAAKTVTTLASREADPRISSPWDVLVRDRVLYIAMAGRHQIWTMDLQTGVTAEFAGSGREEITDGALTDADLAQPSGLATDGTRLFSADSETSSVRAIDLQPGGAVHTLVGRGLFDFGDRDGARDVARLQHPLGVAFDRGKLYVADTYNNKIKVIDPASGECKTFIGTGKAGFADGPALAAELNEPGGLAFGAGKMFIADTNNNLIRVFDPVSGVVSTLVIAGAERLVPEAKPRAFDGALVQLPGQRVRPGAATVEVTVQIPAGCKLNAAAPFCLAVNGEPGKTIINPSFPIKAAIDVTKNQTVTVDLIVYYCEESSESRCLVKRMRLVVPVTVARDSGSDVVSFHAAF